MAILGHFGPFWPILAHFGAILASTGPICVIFGAHGCPAGVWAGWVGCGARNRNFWRFPAELTPLNGRFWPFLPFFALFWIYSGFGPISAVSDPPGVIPSHIWIIMDPSWGSWGRLNDFSNFTLFLERLKVAVTRKIRKMAKNELSWPLLGRFG